MLGEGRSGSGGLFVRPIHCLSHVLYSSYSPCTDSLRVTQFPISSSCFSSDCVGACAVFLSCVFFFSGNILRAEGLIGDRKDVRAPTVTLVNSITSYWTNCVYSGVSFSCSTMLLCVRVPMSRSQLLALARVPKLCELFALPVCVC